MSETKTLPIAEAILRAIMAKILISGSDWTSRALLRAQLIEEGFEVEACEAVQEVVRLPWASKTMPALVVADLFESAHPAEDAVLLSRWAKLAPIWVLAGHGSAEAESLDGRGFERVFYRPLDVGKLVQQIRERLRG
ncbi:MAG TPA: hypothetical protein VFQ24_05175 [Terriglobia bacterium]|nr:hypothetical protein [Terriglobia bacterium]